MTAEEFITKLNNEYGMSQHWPEWLIVDKETYANCCQKVFEHHWDVAEYWDHGGLRIINITLGPDKGLMFKNIELRLK